jgi:hypothetical protein
MFVPKNLIHKLINISGKSFENKLLQKLHVGNASRSIQTEKAYTLQRISFHSFDFYVYILILYHPTLLIIIFNFYAAKSEKNFN